MFAGFVVVCYLFFVGFVMVRLIALMALAILWIYCGADRPKTTAEFVREHCPNAVTDQELEDCTGSYF